MPRPADPARLQALAGRTMGTTWSLKFDNPAMRSLDDVRASVQAALDRVVAQMSTWASDSDISRFNRAAAGSGHTLSAEFCEVLDCALQWAAASDGAIDPTVGPLVGLWGFGAQAAAGATPPSPHDLAIARRHVGWHRIAMDRTTRSIVQPGGAALDLSGIAKGFAVDLVATTLQTMGFTDFLAEVGGELRGIGGRPDGRPWQVQVDAAPDVSPRVTLADMAIATSGDRWHAREHDGRRWSHTIDPRSGEPARHALASVTVVHRQCMQADALATLLTVLGPDDGFDFAQQHAIAALFVSREATGHRPRASNAWSAFAA